MTQITVYSPLGINMVESRAAAPRLKALEGARIGLLNNSKTNSLLLQEEIVKLLEGHHGLGAVAKNIKPNAALRAEGLEEFSREVDAAIAALGDWGSCTSWSIHDSVEMEKLGIPTVTVCTDAFINLAREESRNLGLPDLALAIIRHPVGGESAEVVAQRAHDALDQVVQGLTAEPR